MSTMAERLQAFRHAVGLTQREVASMCHIGKRTLIYWEMGEREIRCSKLIPLMREYDLNFNWLIAEEGEMYIEPTSYTGQGLSDPELDHAYEIDDTETEAPTPTQPDLPESPPDQDANEDVESTDADVLPLIRRLRRE